VEGGTVREAEGLVQRENRQITERPHRSLVDARKPRHSRILDQQQTALVAPPAPAGSILREAKVVGQVEPYDALVEQLRELIFVWLERVGRLVKAAPDTGAEERFHLDAAVVGGNEQLGTRFEPARP
jgi:hypothetical protein